MSDTGKCPLCGTAIAYKEYLDVETGRITCPACLRKFNIVNLKETKK